MTTTATTATMKTTALTAAVAKMVAASTLTFFGFNEFYNHETRQAAPFCEPRGQRFAVGPHARRREGTGL